MYIYQDIIYTHTHTHISGRFDNALGVCVAYEDAVRVLLYTNKASTLSTCVPRTSGHFDYSLGLGVDVEDAGAAGGIPARAQGGARSRRVLLYKQSQYFLLVKQVN